MDISPELQQAVARRQGQQPQVPPEAQGTPQTPPIPPDNGFSPVSGALQGQDEANSEAKIIIEALSNRLKQIGKIEEMQIGGLNAPNQVG